LSPIFSLFPDPAGAAWRALEPATAGEPFGSVTDDDGSITRIWRCPEPDVVASVQDALRDGELLIADGHHRYETARVYAEEVGGEGEHRYTLMFLCAMSDPGMAVLPTHRLITNLDDGKREALKTAIESSFDANPVRDSELAPPANRSGSIELGYLDAAAGQP